MPQNFHSEATKRYARSSGRSPGHDTRGEDICNRDKPRKMCRSSPTGLNGHPTSSRRKTLESGSVVPEFAHLVSENSDISDAPTRITTSDSCSSRPYSSRNDDSLSTSDFHRSVIFSPMQILKSPPLGEHLHGPVRAGTPYPSEERDLSRSSQKLGSKELESESSVERTAEALTNMQFKSDKAKLVTIGGRSRTYHNAQHSPRHTTDTVTDFPIHGTFRTNTTHSNSARTRTPAHSESLARNSTPIVPGAWPATPPPQLPRGFSDCNTPPASSQDEIKDASSIASLPNQVMAGCLRELSISHLIHGPDTSSRNNEMNVARTGHWNTHNPFASRPLRDLSRPSLLSNAHNRVSVDEMFARDYYTNTMEMVQNRSNPARITQEYQSQYQPQSREETIYQGVKPNQWTEKRDSASSMGTHQSPIDPSPLDRNIEDTNDSSEEDQVASRGDDSSRIMHEYLNQNPYASALAYAGRPLPSLPVRDVPGMTTTNTLSSVSLAFDAASDTTSPHVSIISPPSPPIASAQATPRPLPTPQIPQVPQRASTPGLTRTTSLNPTNTHLNQTSSNPVSYTCSTRASVSIPGTSNPPSPSVGVYNSKESILRTASGRMYLMPNKQDPVDLTRRLEDARRMEESADKEMEEFATACAEMSIMSTVEEDREGQGLRAGRRKPYQLSAAHEERRKALIQRHFRKSSSEVTNGSGSPATSIYRSTAYRNAPSPDQHIPQAPSQPLIRSHLYANFSYARPNSRPARPRNTHHPNIISPTPISSHPSTIIDQEFINPLRPFSLSSHTVENPISRSPSPSWEDVDSTVSNTPPPLLTDDTTAIADPTTSPDTPAPVEMQEVDPANNKFKQHLVMVYQSMRIWQQSFQQYCKRKYQGKRRGVKRSRSTRELSPSSLIRFLHRRAMRNLKNKSGGGDSSRRKKAWKRCVKFSSALKLKRDRAYVRMLSGGWDANDAHGGLRGRCARKSTDLKILAKRMVTVWVRMARGRGIKKGFRKVKKLRLRRQKKEFIIVSARPDLS
ncbi:unnamed protein product [Periconia digitata]|uniref:Uncharacterized protein n=1 Tax=Periconia digitata TaxID=1303443 RepID=A0A9W4UAL6_9PLEO|nr:unnamed protein product [Periconia digitata]